MRQIARTASRDRISHISRLIATNHTIQQIADILSMSEDALYPVIRRHAYFLVASLPTSKYNSLLAMLKKDRTVEDISIMIGVPVTLINCAKKLLEKDDYPAPK